MTDDGQGEQPSPLELANQPAIGYRGKFLRPRGFLAVDSPARMRTDGQGQSATRAPTAPLSALAIVALVLAVILPPAGIVCGHLAKGYTRHHGLRGHGLAVFATVLGYVLTVILILVAVIWALFAIAAAHGELTTFHTSSTY